MRVSPRLDRTPRPRSASNSNPPVCHDFRFRSRRRSRSSASSRSRRTRHAEGAKLGLDPVPGLPDSGEFEFSSVPIGNYTVTVSSQGFQQTQQRRIVQSDTSPGAAFPAGGRRREGNCRRLRTPVEATTDSVTPTTMLNRDRHPGNPRSRPHQRHGDDHRLRARLPT
jgi:hypothetical protein